ncbi:proteasome component M29 [Knufia obscura]|uniref:Proteasome component M29 n=1 Tax=Knufia obscura TaxID=1635080 RepID=A0ABR0RTZ9_9EURO|nr:proteasome component M29 [Knufia obscura]
MASSASADFARERGLIEKLEFRIAAADTGEKLQNILQKFLPALLLKLASESADNRNLTIKVCQYINQRLKIDGSIQLPVEGLSKIFRESPNSFVKQFSLLFVQQGLNRLSPEDGISSLPAILRSSIQASSHDQNDRKLFAISIDLLLGILQHWKPPEHGSKEDEPLKNRFDLSREQTKILSDHLSYFLLFDPRASSSPHLSEDLRPVFGKHYSKRGTIAPNLAEFLFTSIFSDEERFLPATILSVDANAAASSRADVMFKQCNFDLESDTLVGAAFELYSIAKPRLQTRILTLLSRSKASTSKTDTIVDIIESQLSTPALNLEASKLRAAMFSYLIWAIRVSPEIKMVAGRLQASLKGFIEAQGWPVASKLSTSDIELRARAYESIGLLSTPSPPLQGNAKDEMDIDSHSMFDLAAWLFTSLRCDTARDVRHSIEESLSRLIAATTIDNADEIQRFRDLLLWNVTANEGDEDPIYHMPTHASAQYPAVRFANKVFAFSDPDARLIDVIALASQRREVVEEGQRGLDPSWHAANSRLSGAQKASALALPTFSQFAEKALGKDNQLLSNGALESASAMAGLVSFCRNLIAAEAWHESSFEVANDSEWHSRVEATLDNEHDARLMFKTQLKKTSNDSVGQLLQTCYEGLAEGSVDCGRVGLQLTSLTTNDVLNELDAASLAKLAAAMKNIQVRTLAARITGIVLSARKIWEGETTSSLASCEHWQTAVGQELAAVEVSLLKSAYVLSRAALRGYVAQGNELVASMWSLCGHILTKSTDKALRQIAYTSIGQLALCLPASGQQVDKAEALVESMLADAKKENESAIMALGRFLSFVWAGFDTENRTKLLDKLFDLHEVRKAEFQFALGEALAVAALRFKSSSTLTEFDVDADEPKTSEDTELFDCLLTAALEKCRTTKPALKKAAGIWLLSLIQFCTSGELVKPRLRDCQAAFSRLLTDRDEIVQETGSRGLGIVYEKGDKGLRDDLVRDLVGSFTGNNARTAGTVTEETQLFEPGALPTENGQSVTTYKDIVSLAQEMGDPSLVYRFMNLASNNAIWSSRAAFGRFGLSGMLADSTYLKENKKFYPKLFRYRFDPNQNVQRSMDDIWKALVKDPNAVIDENFDLIMEDLLKSIVAGREWRAREASCAAISDLVQGREVEKLEKHLEEIWKVAFKVLDDVKESVRNAAMKLCRTLTNMLIRNLEVGEGTTKRATTMLNHAMPFLLQQMEAGAGKEVQQYAIVTLLDVVKKAPPRSLQSYAPVILETFINSLSSLEHESINYLHLNADKYGLTAEKLDNMRVSSIGASPVSEAIEKCFDSLAVKSTQTTDPASMDGIEPESSPLQDAMKRLESSFKVAIGLPSRVGLSRAMITLVVRHNTVFRPYADRFVRLTRKSIVDRNATISQSFSTALAYLLRLASEKEIRQTISYAQKLYFESQELSHRAIAGEIVQAISKASNDVFMNFATSFLPFAFIGRKDLDEDTRERFETAWKDNVGGSRAMHLYLREIVDLTQKHIKSSLWPIRHACCFAVAELITTMESGQEYGKEDASLLWPLAEEALSGKTWDGKEKVVEAFPPFVKRARAIWPDKSKQMQTIAIREAKRTNLSYRPHAISALAEFANIRLDLDISRDVMPFLIELVESLIDDTDAMDVDGASAKGDRSSEILLNETLSAAITCMCAVLRGSSTPETLDSSLAVLRNVRSRNESAVELSLYQAAKSLIARIIIGEDATEDMNATDSVSLAGPKSAGTNQLDKEKFGPFLHELALATLGPASDTDTENLRSARIQLGLTLSRTEILSPETRESLNKIFASWLENERSRPLRLSIEQAINVNKTSLSS